MIIRLIKKDKDKNETLVLDNVSFCSVEREEDNTILGFALEKGSSPNAIQILSHAGDPNFNSDLQQFGVNRITIAKKVKI